MRISAQKIAAMIVALSFVFQTQSAYSIPKLIGYQGQISLPSGDLAPDGNYSITLRIYSDSILGMVLWQEGKLVVQQSGVFSTAVGSAQPLPDSIFENESLWLGLQIGLSSEISPRTALLSTPYSFRSEKSQFADSANAVTANSLTGLNLINQSIGLDKISQSGAALGQVPKWNGTAWQAATDTSNAIGPFLENDTTIYTESSKPIFRNTGTNSVSNFAGQLNLGSDSNQTDWPNSVVLAGKNNNSSNFSTVVNGSGNTAIDYGFVGSGRNNRATNDCAILSGYACKASGNHSAIGGGRWNNADGLMSFIGSGDSNSALSDYSCVLSGYGNSIAAGSNTIRSAIAGGKGNSVPFGKSCFIGGGESNLAESDFAAVVGGFTNDANSYSGSVLGGSGNLVQSNHGSVVGGRGNWADGGGFAGIFVSDSSSCWGFGASVLGGKKAYITGNGQFSSAMGFRPFVDHYSVFMWSDSSNHIFSSVANNEFAVRSRGGIRFVTGINGSGVPITGVFVAAGGGSWSSISDSAVKKNIEAIDEEVILAKIDSLSLSTWNYRTQADSIRHIGPMAQDFYRLFGVGESDKTITSIDADGVALAAIKALLRRTEILNQVNSKIRELEERLKRLEQK